MAWLSNLASSLASMGSRLRPRPDPDKLALQLLSEILSPDQRAQYTAYGYFEVAGGQTGKRYRINAGSQMNVEELDASGRRVRGLCFLPRGGVPIGDIMVAQKLALELMEVDALNLARPSWLADPSG